MIPALILGRKGSRGFPGKNTHPVLGRPMSQYTMLGARHARSVTHVFLSTDDELLMELARNNGVEVIVRPPELCTASALGEDAYQHGYDEIRRRYPREKIEFVVLLFCNAPTFMPAMIDEGVDILRKKSDIDSAVTACRMNWYSPARARRMNAAGLLEPFIPFAQFSQGTTINCDRDAQGDCYFTDVCVSVIRPQNLDHLDQGMLPQKWMGQRIHPIRNIGGLDIDEEWQLPLIEGYLLRNGFTTQTLPYA